jgi:hypothetical protein
MVLIDAPTLPGACKKHKNAQPAKQTVVFATMLQSSSVSQGYKWELLLRTDFTAIIAYSIPNHAFRRFSGLRKPRSFPSHEWACFRVFNVSARKKTASFSVAVRCLKYHEGLPVFH